MEFGKFLIIESKWVVQVNTTDFLSFSVQLNDFHGSIWGHISIVRMRPENTPIAFSRFFFVLVTRLITRVLHEAGFEKLSQCSVIIKRNRRFDAAALKQRNVTIPRRASNATPAQAQIVQQRRRFSVASTSNNIASSPIGVQQLTAPNNGNLVVFIRYCIVYDCVLKCP